MLKRKNNKSYTVKDIYQRQAIMIRMTSAILKWINRQLYETTMNEYEMTAIYDMYSKIIANATDAQIIIERIQEKKG